MEEHLLDLVDGQPVAARRAHMQRATSPPPRRAGRATQGVIVMRLREGEQVATLAPVVGSDEGDDVDALAEAAADVAALPEADGPADAAQD